MLNTNKKNNAGAKPYDVVLLFKILILQRYYGLGDSQVEYQILDRTSFKTFLGLETGDKVPDEKTVWSFRERVTKTGLVEELFEQFTSFLEQQELIFNEGQLVDASFTIAPRQRNTREENKKMEREMIYGMTNPTKKNIKTLMLVGQRKTEKRSTGIKITQK